MPLTQLIPYSHTNTHTHTFKIVSLLLALMADLCLPLSAGEDTFELHSVQLELEAMERRIHKLLGKKRNQRNLQNYILHSIIYSYFSRRVQYIVYMFVMGSRCSQEAVKRP